MKDQVKALGVLTSGGVESAALVAEALSRYERVYPIYVRKGLQWEDEEQAALRKFLTAFEADGLAKLTVLEMPLKPVYGNHWSLGFGETPSGRASDAAVFLPGRNLLLLSLAGLFCSLRRIPRLWIGVLKGNPFTDATPGFFRKAQDLVGESLGGRVVVEAPFRKMSKGQVIARWSNVPWEKTISCLRPSRGRHCGRCQKCAERKKGFKEAGVADPTPYA